MIRLVSSCELPKKGISQWLLPADRPKQQRDIRKLIFFFFREGPRQAIAKVLAKLNKQKSIDSQTIALRYNQMNAISYDGGKTFYISDIPAETWSSPFSYDYDLEQTTAFPGCVPINKENSLYFIGYGDYAQTYSGALKRFCHPRMFVEYNQTIIEKFRNDFEYASHSFCDLQGIWRNESVPVAVLASYHSDHARQAFALWQSKPESFIFIEKPPLVDYQDIELYRSMYSAGANIQIGFNRRYSPLVLKIKESLTQGQPKFINISVNEVKISEHHWYLWPNQGTRITGNACHWIDICQYFINQRPVKMVIASSTKSSDDCVLVISYIDGSLAVISLTDKGNDLRGVQESIEIKQANCTYRLDDMLRLVIDQPGKSRKVFNKLIRDKGHKRMYESFAKDVKRGAVHDQYPLTDLEIVSKLTYEFSRMLVNGITEQNFLLDDNQ